MKLFLGVHSYQHHAGSPFFEKIMQEKKPKKFRVFYSLALFLKNVKLILPQDILLPGFLSIFVGLRVWCSKNGFSNVEKKKGNSVAL